jgi:hypothetical protein
MIKAAKRLDAVEEYYFSRKLAEVRSLDTPGFRVINLGIGSPDLPPSSAAIEALVASAQNPSHHGYQSYKGIPAFRKAIAEFSRKTYGTVLDPETMILPPGWIKRRHHAHQHGVCERRRRGVDPRSGLAHLLLGIQISRRKNKDLFHAGRE